MKQNIQARIRSPAEGEGREYVLVSSGCHNKILWLKQQRFIFSWFGRLKSEARVPA